MTRVISTLAESFGSSRSAPSWSLAVSTHYARKRRERNPSACQRADLELVGEIHRARGG